MLVKTFAAAVQGISATIITVEVNATRGVQFYMVGLPDSAVRESHERIISALDISGYKFPRKRIIINMSPADIRKEGSAYDLPLAISVLAAAEQIDSSNLADYLIMGELSLDGTILPIKGALPIAVKAREKGFKGFILPKQNEKEASVVSGLEIYGVDTIREVIEFIDGKRDLQPASIDLKEIFYTRNEQFDYDFSDVKGQEHVKRALEVAAAGGHNILMVGPPGSGKSMMAKRLPSILPPFTLEESLETTKIHSVAGKINLGKSLITERPFRSPHHTISNVAMVGGGSFPQPGEISLAHHGVLYLDELPEFSRSVLEVLRQPLEDRLITISRARFTVEYPAGFMLVTSLNPCPCGYYNHPDRPCVCPLGAVQKYMNKISGPLLDRIDIQVEITPVPFEKIASQTLAEKSNEIRERVIKARNIQEERFRNHPGIHCNARMTSQLLNKYSVPNEKGMRILKNAMENLNLSARAYDRILKVSRTVADLENSENIQTHHIAEAINYRNLDRAEWGT